MSYFNRTKQYLTVFILASLFYGSHSFAESAKFRAEVSDQIFEKVRKNHNWKFAYLTAKEAQVVFMNISPDTSRNNDIGMESHSFDQIIFVVSGRGEAVLDGKREKIRSGDMIFIPQGTLHNVINSNAKKPLKILSIYTSTDIPAGSAVRKKSDHGDS